MSFLFLFWLPWHRSRCSMSACSSFRNRAIIRSIDAMTLSKWPLAITSTASFASPRLWLCWARALSRAKALARPPSLCPAVCWAESCMKFVVAFRKTSWEVLFERIRMALFMPSISSVRSRSRVDHSQVFFLNAVLRAATNALVAFSSAFASSRMSVVTARSSVLAALVKIRVLCVSFNVCSSSCFVAISTSKAFCWSASSALAFSSPAAKASYMPFRTPWICVDCGA
mmetsp:Transcript_96460/g.268041  ORF Transcript_96460/g.268041 Transcript_96460/m.268041 type:complete len:228 (-) Transcript_96460:807-1490(-)